MLCHTKIKTGFQLTISNHFLKDVSWKDGFSWRYIKIVSFMTNFLNFNFREANCGIKNTFNHNNNPTTKVEYFDNAATPAKVVFYRKICFVTWNAKDTDLNCYLAKFAGKSTNRSSHRRCYVKNGVFKNFTNFTGKHLCWSLFLIKNFIGKHLCWNLFLLFLFIKKR